MITIAKSRGMRSETEKVWVALTDWEKEGEYWTNIRNIRVLSNDGTTIEREADVGPRAFSQRTVQTVVLQPKRLITLKFGGAQIKGERQISITATEQNETRVDVIWEIELEGIPGFVERIVRDQISGVTEKALEGVAGDAERESTSKPDYT